MTNPSNDIEVPSISVKAGCTPAAEPQRPRRFLAVAAAGDESVRLKRYAVELGHRIGCQVILLQLENDPAGIARTPSPSCLVTACAEPSRDAGLLEYQAAARQVQAAVEELSQTLKRIEFILTDSDDVKEILSEAVMPPVFRIETANQNPGGSTMSNPPRRQNGREIAAASVLGLITVALYAAVFLNADLVMRLFTRGGAYAALPIGTVFAFSFAHGAFSSRLWSLLGIQARPKTEAYKSVTAAPQPVKSKPKRPRAYAHVNPFHNIELKAK